MDNRLNLILASMIAVHVVALLYKPMILAILPLLAVTGGYSVPLLLGLFDGKAMPLATIKNDYVYDVGSGVINVFYSLEPLFNSSRMSGKGYAALVTEFVQRLQLDDDVLVSFIVMGSKIMARIGLKIAVDDMAIARARFLSIERILGEYFVIRKRLNNADLREFYGIRGIKLTVKHSPLIIVSFMYFIVYGIPGLLMIASVASFFIYGIYRGKWVSSDLPFNYVMRSNDNAFKDIDDDSLRALSLAHNGINSYCVIFQGNPDLQGKARKMYHKANEGNVVKEMGKYYFDAIKWRNVINRINSGELPIRLLVLSALPIGPGYTHRLPAPYLFARPAEFMSDGLSRDLMIYLPFRAAEESSGSSIRIGRDRQGNPINVNMDLLPNMHGLIVGPTGMGKTWTMKTLLARLMSRNIMPIVVDPHGEYASVRGIREIDVTKQMINMFDLGGITRTERISRIAEGISLSFQVNAIDEIIEDLELAYAGGEIKDNKDGIKRLMAVSQDARLVNVYERIGEAIEGSESMRLDDLISSPTSITFKGVAASPDVTRFLMLQWIDHIYGYILSRNVGGRRLLVIDEAYYVLSNRLIELYVRGTRKFGLGIFLITQELGDLSPEAVQNIPFNILLAGPDPYVASIASIYNLSEEDIRWLTQALPPQALGGAARAMLIRGPLKDHVMIELEKN
ncbi:hypothetical protein GCM10007981_11860 [Thermocladium modestius]|uniref:Helicase HerA central domain-containing protein n=1 Tax=Thermocladium modestius TaxID=62609 RepID=A0A830GVI5_9CREN|nr:DUF87 domain-containing protein [Thermocladium modestius]GGP21163.1 hypothetical protein GCM10007981_11860 [Thermocladium modestius]